MSDIERFVTIWGGGGMMPADNGNYVRYADHRAEVERLKTTLFPLETYDRLKNANEHLKENVAKLTAERDAAQVEVERLKNAIDHLARKRDEAQAERDAVQRERERVQALLWVRERELPTLQRDQSAQNLDMANGQAILDSLRPDDETIWREAFMAAIQGGRVYDRMTVADLALADYRKRWPR